MTELREVGKIQVHEDLSFQRAEWKWQRVGWIGMALILLLGLLGVLGHGVLARAETGHRSVLAVEYERIIRHGSDTELTIHVGHALSREPRIRVIIPTRYLSSFDVGAIIPEPSATGVRGSAVYYEFARAASGHPATVVFQLRPKAYWRQRATIAAGARAVRFKQIILP